MPRRSRALRRCAAHAARSRSKGQVDREVVGHLRRADRQRSAMRGQERRFLRWPLLQRPPKGDARLQLGRAPFEAPGAMSCIIPLHNPRTN